MIKKTILMAVFGLLITTVAYSQSPGKHEFSVWGMGGLSTLKYSVDNGDRKGGIGGAIGVGYTYFLNDAFGIGSGLEVSMHNAEAKFADMYNVYTATDFDNMDFEFRSRTTGYKETQNALFLNIPITLQFQTPVNETAKFYASGGMKVGIPLSSKYKAKKGQIKNSGYYVYENYEYEDVNSLGFGTMNTRSKKESFDLDVAFILTLEAGLKWNVAQNGLYTGLYVDYGLNDIGKGSRSNYLVEYNTKNPVGYISNSILDSRYGEGINKTTFVDKVVPLAFGVKVKYSFNLE